MKMTGVGMIAADTARSRAYLQAVLKRGMEPQIVLFMRDPKGGKHYGQADRRPDLIGEFEGVAYDLNEPLLDTIERAKIPVRMLETVDINSRLAIDAVKEAKLPVLIWSGVGGMILDNDILSAGSKFLHVHGGYLPEYKGSTANFYSLLAEAQNGASAIFLVREIDCGPILARRNFNPPRERQKMDYFFDSVCRATVLTEILESHERTGHWPAGMGNDGGTTYFVIHPVMKHLALLAKTPKTLERP